MVLSGLTTPLKTLLLATPPLHSSALRTRFYKLLQECAHCTMVTSPCLIVVVRPVHFDCLWYYTYTRIHNFVTHCSVLPVIHEFLGFISSSHVCSSCMRTFLNVQLLGMNHTYQMFAHHSCELPFPLMSMCPYSKL